ncbi:RNA polymerase sigma factor [Steroidobacter sp.]|uniref:RNA polymerase sigma factor n=1 Tax=Steroidobacter sp. TaxID=1978227 RepID=UPI001A4E43FE|nr:RNA polymerase sigma factor [Steroidobacter sp.]MBL8268910.1 RNA polymerase sigma factor [Steroidobacter sp.]
MSHFQGIEVAAEVVRAAQAGEARAHEVIYLACRRPIYSLIRRLVVRAAIADELFQETFVEVLRNVGAYSGEGAFGGWVRSIAVSKCLMYLRSPWHRSLLYMDNDDDESTAPVVLLDTASHPDAQAAASADVERALATLPALTRSVVWLHDVEGYTHAEIGRLLGRTASFSKSQLSRAHARLRELLEQPAESSSCTHVSSIC